jgi:hypothetical protein
MTVREIVSSIRESFQEPVSLPSWKDAVTLVRMLLLFILLIGLPVYLLARSIASPLVLLGVGCILAMASLLYSHLKQTPVVEADPVNETLPEMRKRLVGKVIYVIAISYVIYNATVRDFTHPVAGVFNRIWLIVLPTVALYWIMDIIGTVRCWRKVQHAAVMDDSDRPTAS